MKHSGQPHDVFYIIKIFVYMDQLRNVLLLPRITAPGAGPAGAIVLARTDYVDPSFIAIVLFIAAQRRDLKHTQLWTRSAVT